jgi:VWFA-related protein
MMRAPAFTLARRNLATAIILCGCAGAYFPAAHAQKIRSGVDLTRVVVSVLNGERLPVKGLTAADFTIRVDGQVRKIVVCDTLDIETRSTLSAPTIGDPTADRPQQRELPRVVVLVIDDAMMDMDDLWAVEKVREISQTIIRNLRPADLASVAFTISGRRLELTNNVSDLTSAVDQFRPGGPLGHLGSVYTLRTLQNTVDGMREFTDQRKAVYYIGAGVRINPVAVSSPTALGVPGDGRALEAEKHALLQQIVTVASTAAIPIYAIDPYGLVVSNVGGDPRKLQRDFMQTLAANSGGRAIVNTNEFTSGLQGIARENTYHYLLAYETLPRDLTKASLRLEVETRRKDVLLRAPKRIRPGKRADDSV